jgi:predicted ATPase/Tfp pilus assembly protein PilF
VSDQQTILTPDQRLRVFVSSTLQELAEERKGARRAIERLRLTPVMFELGARPHPPMVLYRAYLDQSQVFVGIYWQRYGWVAPEETVSGLEDEYNLSGSMAKLIYIKSPAPEREPQLKDLLNRIRDDDHASYKSFETPSELRILLENDLMVLLSERFETTRGVWEGPPETAKHNLPAPRTSFVGREREMLEVKRALARTRLLTLTGVGGSGKTRLALEVARNLVESYPDGVWFVELAPLSEPELVPKAAASALGVPERSGQPLTDTLIEALRPKNLLIVLDNCEHLVVAAVRLVDALLDTCPNLRFLATSRETLNASGETNRPVVPLGVLASEREPTVVTLEGSESARLFLERARHRNPSFVLTQENARAVAESCRILSGLPLAIELAAARVGTLTVEQIAERLRNPLELLSGTRTAPPRHRTLRATLDWSYELLGDRERTLFRRLSVFAGGSTLESAEIVGAGDEVEEGDIVNLLSGLVEKSLVVAEPNEKGEMRYRMLEPVRQYAREKLQECGETGLVGRRHATYFLALAEEELTTFTGGGRPEWIGHLEEEHDNLRTALSWALDSEEVEFGLRLAGALQPFWGRLGNYGEGRRWLEVALAKDDRVSPTVRARGLNAVGWMAHWQGDIERASAAAEEGLRLSPLVEEGRVISHLRLLLGFTAGMRGDYERATKVFEENLRVGKEAGDEWSIAASLLHLGNVAVNQSKNEQGVHLYEEGIALCRKSGYAVLLADILVNLGYERLLQGDHERATALCEEAIALYQEQGYRYARLEFPMDNLGWAALLRGDEEQASVLHQESLSLCRKLGNRLVAAESLEGLACAAAIRGETQRSARLFGAADALLKSQEISHLPVELVLREPYLTAARSNKASWEEGNKMTFEEAVEYALSGNQSSSSPGLPMLGQPSIED